MLVEVDFGLGVGDRQVLLEVVETHLVEVFKLPEILSLFLDGVVREVDESVV